MDTISQFAEYLKENSTFKDEEIATICSYWDEKRLSKEEILFRSNERYSKLIFVVTGILRVYIVDNSGEEIIKNFTQQHEFLADLDSFENQLPAKISVAAITDCVLLTLTRSASDELNKTFPNWSFLVKDGALKAQTNMITMQNFLRIGNSAEQYKYFVKNFPSLAKEVPLKYIASYLRITQSSLSRLRKQHW
jgi:CRP-like cAMP-binding protein